MWISTFLAGVSACERTKTTMKTIQKLTKNDINLINTLNINEKKSIIDNYTRERNRLVNKYSKLDIGIIDDAFSRFPYASIDKTGKVTVNNNRLDREIYLGMVK